MYFYPMMQGRKTMSAISHLEQLKTVVLCHQTIAVQWWLSKVQISWLYFLIDVLITRKIGGWSFVLRLKVDFGSLFCATLCATMRKYVPHVPHFVAHFIDFPIWLPNFCICLYFYLISFGFLIYVSVSVFYSLSVFDYDFLYFGSLICTPLCTPLLKLYTPINPDRGTFSYFSRLAP